MRDHAISRVVPLLLLSALPAAPLRAAESPLLSLDATRSTASELLDAARGPAPARLFRITNLRDDRGRPLTLALERASLFADDFRLYVDGKERPGAVAAAGFVFLRGTSEEWPGSSVALTVDLAGGRIDGVLATQEGLQDVSLGADAGELPLASGLQVRSREPDELPYREGTDVLTAGPTDAPLSPTTEALRVIAAPGAEYRARVAIDSDFEFLQAVGGEQAALGYLANTLNVVSEVYFAQVRVSLEITIVRLWTTPNDPWLTPDPHSSVHAALLCEFARHWQKHRRSTTAFPRDAALFFSGKTSSDHGGQAFLSSLCHYRAQPSACPYGGYGTVLTFFFGTVRNTAFVTAHELGHIFGSPHTHCYQPPVDHCHNGEQRCHAGTESSPADGGSVMSYCEQRNLSLGEVGRFGDASERVPARIRWLVDALGATCMQRTSDPYGLAAAPGARAAVLSWTDPFGDETSWIVEQRGPKGKFKQVRALPRNSTTHTVTGLKPGEQAFRVRAKLRKAVSDYSAVAVVIVP